MISLSLDQIKARHEIAINKVLTKRLPNIDPLDEDGKREVQREVELVNQTIGEIKALEAELKTATPDRKKEISEEIKRKKGFLNRALDHAETTVRETTGGRRKTRRNVGLRKTRR